MVTGDPIGYVAAAGHRPIPLATDQNRRAPHAAQPAKPKSTGLDWDHIERLCLICDRRRPGRLTPEGACADCAPHVTPSTAPARTQTSDRTYAQMDPADVEAKFTAPTRPPLAAAVDALGGWKVQRMAGFNLTKPWAATTPGCPDGSHPTRDCGCKVFATADEARTYVAFQLDDGADPLEPPARASRDRFDAATAKPATKTERPVAPTQPVVPPVKAKIQQAGPDDVIITLRAPGITHRQTEIAALLTNLLAGLHQTPAPAGAASPQGREKREGATRKGKPAAPSRANTGGTRKSVDEKAIVAEYVGGDTAPAVAERHGIQPKRVRAIVERHGHQLRDDRPGNSGGHNQWDPDDATRDEIIQYYTERHYSLARLAERFNVHQRTVRRLLEDNGVQVRPPAHVSNARPLTDEELQQITLDYQTGKSIKDLALKYRIGRDRITHALESAGLKRRAPAGQRQPDGFTDRREYSKAVRAWAHGKGLIDPGLKTGRLPTSVLDAYAEAHPTEKEHTTA